MIIVERIVRNCFCGCGLDAPIDAAEVDLTTGMSNLTGCKGATRTASGREEHVHLPQKEKLLHEGAGLIAMVRKLGPVVQVCAGRLRNVQKRASAHALP